MIRRGHLLLLLLFRRLPVRARRRVVRTLAPAFTVGSMCCIEDDAGRLLLVRQSYRNRWGVPGGLLRRSEEPEVAAHREVLEEVGVAVELVSEPCVVVDPLARRVDLVFRARLADGVDPARAVPGSPEIVEARWFPMSELPELQPETSGALEALARRY
ncbi:MAG: NUDIX hydrolase [Microthrixaceae bacterium]